MLYNVPIERFEERYTEQWWYWFKREFYRNKIIFHTVYPQSVEYGGIKEGSFLDVVGTNRFKAYQLSHICELFVQDYIRDKDVFFFHDLWFPGIEMLAYMRQGLQKKFKIYGVLHAGSYDEHDFLHRVGMDEWARFIEKGWLQFIDGIFVGTQFHKDLLVSKRCVAPEKVHVTGLPIFKDDLPFPQVEKEDIVVFPHRLDPEKNPDHFDALSASLRNDLPGWHFIKTKEVCRNKQEYYDLLKKSKIAVSFSEQETWGIAMQEALFAGCVPLVPDKLSYREMYNPMFRFGGFADCRRRIYDLVMYPITFATFVEAAIEDSVKLQSRGEMAIENMINVMGFNG